MIIFSSKRELFKMFEEHISEWQEEMEIRVEHEVERRVLEKFKNWELECKNRHNVTEKAYETILDIIQRSDKL